MNVHSLAFFRDGASGYESPSCGVSQGIFFINFLRSVIRAHHAVWTGWELRIHHDDRVRAFPYFKAMERMHESGLLKLVPMGESKQLCRSMLWRMEPLFDPEVDVVICRDLDSLPMERDRVMVEAFICSRAIIHGINDSESHSIPMLGGMVGFKAKRFREVMPLEELRDSINAFDLSVHGSDQRFLNQVVHPRFANSLMSHTRRNTVSYDCMRAYPVEPQVTPLDNVIRHIGAAFSVDEAMKVLDAMDYPSKAAIEECER